MADIRIPDVPVAPEFVRFREGFGQKFILTVDTEEEFDWQAPLNRTGHSIGAVPALRQFQQFCEGFGVIPAYLVDYPIATSQAAADVLKDAIAAGRAEIGIQLHPWVNPPHDEDISEFNSYPGNLPAALEEAKFSVLRDAIEKNFGAAPLIYRAGRYGAGPNTAAILKKHGLTIDSSVRTGFEYGAASGPDFQHHPARPYWICRESRLMELPLTTAYWGVLRQQGRWLFPMTRRFLGLRGALARLGILERIPLTPEGVTIDEAIRGIDIALDDGLPLLVFSFHSPSLVPGHTLYVRSAADLDRLYEWWRQIFAHLARRNIAPASVRDIMDSAALA